MKRSLAFLLSLIMILALVACGSKDTAKDDGKGETGTSEGKIKKDLVIGTAQDINQLDPTLQNDQINNNMLRLAHLGLAKYVREHDGAWYGQLAESWEWTSDTRLVVKLREDAYFWTGEKMTADDVIFTYDRIMSEDMSVSILRSSLRGLLEWNKIDDYTVEFIVEQFNNEIWLMMNGQSTTIQSKAAYESGMKDPYLVGLGPYKLKEWVPGQYVTYEKVENWWGEGKGLYDNCKAQEITMKPLLEASQRVIALQNGEIDICIDPPVTELEFLEKDENVTVYTEAGTRLFYMGFNCSKAPFDNVTLRQAIACCIDKDQVIEIVCGGRALPQTSILNRGMWGFLDNDEVEGGYTYDVERAKELLAKAGYKAGELTVDLYTPTDDPYKTIAPIVQANCAAIGVNVNIVSFDQATLKAECGAGNQQMFLWRWNAVERLDEVYGELYTTGSASNYHQLSDPYVDEMAPAIMVEKDEETRKQQGWDLQNYLVEIVPQVPLYVPDLLIAFNSGLQVDTLVALQGGGPHDYREMYVIEK